MSRTIRRGPLRSQPVGDSVCQGYVSPYNYYSWAEPRDTSLTHSVLDRVPGQLSKVSGTRAGDTRHLPPVLPGGVGSGLTTPLLYPTSPSTTFTLSGLRVPETESGVLWLPFRLTLPPAVSTPGVPDSCRVLRPSRHCLRHRGSLGTVSPSTLQTGDGDSRFLGRPLGSPTRGLCETFLIPDIRRPRVSTCPVPDTRVRHLCHNLEVGPDRGTRAVTTTLPRRHYNLVVFRTPEPG